MAAKFIEPLTGEWSPQLIALYSLIAAFIFSTFAKDDFGGARGLLGLLACELLVGLTAAASLERDAEDMFSYIFSGLAACCMLHFASVVASPFLSPVLFGRLDVLERVNWHGRIVGTAFALFSLSMVIAERLDPSPELVADQFFGTSASSRMLVGVTHGFFVWDAAFSWCMAPQELPIRLHALSGVVVGTVCLQPFCHRMIATILLWEASTPLLNLRGHLHACGMEKSAAYTAVSAAFAIVFLGVRWGFGLLDSARYIRDLVKLLFHSMRADGLGGEPRLRYCSVAITLPGIVLMNSMNLMWGFKVLKGLLRAVKLLPPPKKTMKKPSKAQE